MTVSSGKEVSIEFTLRLEDKSVVDTNVGGDPLTYTQGAQQIISGLENEVEGMAVGETKAATIPPEKGYGVMDAAAYREVDNKHVPEGARAVGAKLQGRDSNGQVTYARVAQVKEGTVVLDFNHPLAGKTLFFEVKVLDIKAAPAEWNPLVQHPQWPVSSPTQIILGGSNAKAWLGFTGNDVLGDYGSCGNRPIQKR